MNIFRTDKILLVSIFLALLFCLNGIHWGWVSSFNPDQMALKPLGGPGKRPLQPDNYLKPPFHTYFNAVFSTIPIKVIQKTFDLSDKIVIPILLIWSRILVLFLFIGSIILVYLTAKRFFGTFSAQVISIIFSTSAGFIHHSHFLTADIPLVFWMLLAFYYTQNIFYGGNTKDYILAGLCTGIATATKYNGLAIGIVIVVAHYLSYNPLSWKRIIPDRKIFIGLVMVLSGFLLTNPYAVLDFHNFIADFNYNYIVAQTYGQVQNGNGYWKFYLGSLPYSF